MPNINPEIMKLLVLVITYQTYTLQLFTQVETRKWWSEATLCHLNLNRLIIKGKKPDFRILFPLTAMP